MSASQSDRGRKTLILTVLFLVLLLGAYGYGRWQGAQSVGGRDQSAAISAGADAGTARVRSDLVRLEGETRLLGRQVRLLQARRRLHLALMALDARNFGIARGHLNAVGTDLEALPPDPAAGDGESLSRLARELSSAQLTAGDNLSTHRQRILAWVHELEKQLPALADGSLTPEADVSGSATSPDEPVGMEPRETPSKSTEVQPAAPGSGP